MCEFRTLFGSKIWNLCGVPEKLPTKFGKNISGPRVREARESQTPPLTQDQLAGKVAALGVTLDRTAIAKIENGQRSVCDFELAAMARALRVDTDWLMGLQSKRRE